MRFNIDGKTYNNITLCPICKTNDIENNYDIEACSECIEKDIELSRQYIRMKDLELLKNHIVIMY